MTGERCTVLAEEAVPVAELNRGNLESAMRDLSEDLALAKSDHERTAIEKRIAVINAKLQVAA